MRFPLPILTEICARGAKPIGGFGMVGPAITNTYQSADLALTHGRMTFTNHYHRGLGQGIDMGVLGSVVVGASVVATWATW